MSMNFATDVVVNASNSLQTKIIKVPTTSGGSTYGVGNDGQILMSNGTSSYWGNSTKANWNETDSANPGYIQNRPFGTFLEQVELIPPDEYTFERISEYDPYQFYINAKIPENAAVTGQKFILTFDNIEYEMTGTICEEDGYTWYEIGSWESAPCIVGGEFYNGVCEFNSVSITPWSEEDEPVAGEDTESHTVSLYTKDGIQVFHKLAWSNINFPLELNETSGGILISGASDASGGMAFAHGAGTTASGNFSHAEGSQTTASGFYSHAEGNSTTSSGDASHAEGSGTQATSFSAHSEGVVTVASAQGSHAEGYGTIANKKYVLAAGHYNTSIPAYDITNIPVWASNHAYAVGDRIKDGTSLFRCKTAHTSSNLAGLSYNESQQYWQSIPWDSDILLVVGNGFDDNNRSNALEVHEDGTIVVSSGITIGNTTINAAQWEALSDFVANLVPANGVSF